MDRWSNKLAAALTIAAVLGCASTAHADAATDAALKQFDVGRAAFERGELAPALAAFTASLQGLPSPNTRLYIARCQRGLGKIGSAYTSYTLASHEAADRLNATGEKRYAATRDTAQAEAAEIERNVPHLAITLPSDAPSTTSVKLDGTEVPRTALTSLDVDPGPHTLRVTAPRRTMFEQEIQLAAGEQKRVEVSLARMPTATIRFGFKSRPAGLAVSVDGHPIEPGAVAAPAELDVGEHRVVARAPGYRDFVWKQRLADGDSRVVDVALEPDPQAEGSHGTPKWLFFGVAGVSVATLGIGTYFAVDATSRTSTEKAKDPLTRDPAEQEHIRSQATTANVLFVAGAAIAAGAGVLAFTTDWHGSNRAPAAVVGRVYPWLGPAGGGVGATGSF